MNPPCIRNLERFKKTGCPQKSWNGKEGCPAWIELLVTPKGEPLKPKDKIGRCIDHWNFEFQLTALGLIEGNQHAMESFRNGMIETREDGKDYPKPDSASLALFELFTQMQNQRKAIFEHEVSKQLKE